MLSMQHVPPQPTSPFKSCLSVATVLDVTRTQQSQHQQISDVLETSAAAAAGRGSPPARIMRLSFDSHEMATESAEFVRAEVARNWRQRKEDATELLRLPA